MKKLIVGVVIGLSLGVAPAIAEWDWNDYEVLKHVRDGVRDSVGMLKRIAVAQERIATAEEHQMRSMLWQARSLERLSQAWGKDAPKPPAEKP